MIGHLESIVPPLIVLIIILYVLRNPYCIAMLSFPFLLGNNAYMYFNGPYLGRTIPIYNNDVFVIIMILVCFFRRKSSSKSSPHSIHRRVYMFLLAVLIFYLSMQFLSSIGTLYSSLLHSLRTFKTYAIFPISIYVWYKYFCTLSAKELYRFFKGILYVTLPLSVLYILSANGIAVYRPPVTSHVFVQIATQSGTAVRDLSTVPAFLFVSLSYLMALLALRFKAHYAFAAFLLIIAALSTATRGIAIALVLAMVIAILHALRNNSKHNKGKQIAILIVFTIAFSAVWSKLPIFLHMQGRVEDAAHQGTEVSTFQHRITAIDYVYNTIDHDVYTLLFGNGYFTTGYYSANMELYFADSLYSQLLFMFGMFGLTVYLLLMLYPIIIDVKRLYRYISVSILTSVLHSIMFLSMAFIGSNGLTSAAPVYALPFGLFLAHISRFEYDRESIPFVRSGNHT